jgi:AGCS family alanine or glycine:cation symporter
MFRSVGGNMFQANQTFAQVQEATGGGDGPLGSPGSALIFGIVLALLVGAVILGGITTIAKVTSRLVPFMAITYLVSCLLVILSNFTNIPERSGRSSRAPSTPRASPAAPSAC